MEYNYKCGCRGRGLCAKGSNTGHYGQLNTFNYLADIPDNQEVTDLVEVQFKNTRKGYFHNINNLPLQNGDLVAVEATAGHDIGTVTLTGKLVALQIKKANLRSNEEIKRIYRIARPTDLERYEAAKAREHETMIKSRQIAKDLGLEMKIGDVEYQGDGNKAIFYYIADGRVDFRQLIKVLAEEFRVRIEMKQIGARQEAGRIGGFGPCGRELCQQEKATPQFQRLLRVMKEKFGAANNMPAEVREELHSESLKLMKYNGMLTFNFRTTFFILFCLIDLPSVYFIVFEVTCMEIFCRWIRHRHEGFCKRVADRL